MKHRHILATLVATTLTSCATTSAPPGLSGTDRVPINGPAVHRLLDAMAMPEPVEAEPDEHEHEPRLFTRAPDPMSLIELGKDGTVSRIVSVPFAFADDAFRPTPDQRYLMRRLSTVANRIDVRGRTDSYGDTATNRSLAEQRAMAAKRYLVQMGVPAELIAISYVASGDPIGDEKTREGRAMNRRAEIEFHVAPVSRS